jgi:hypothetical protein
LPQGGVFFHKQQFTMLHLWLTLQAWRKLLYCSSIYTVKHTLKKGVFASKLSKMRDQALPKFIGKNPRTVPENTEFAKTPKNLMLSSIH